MTGESHPVLLENLGLRWPGFRIRRVALNQHMPRVERFSEHVHAFTQWLLYLRGEGVQHFGERQLPVRRGTLLGVPPRQAHRFEKSGPVRPLCLVVDLDCPPGGHAGETSLGEGELTRVEQLLMELHGLSRRESAPTIRTAAVVLELVDCLQRTLAGRRSRESVGPVAAAVRARVQRLGWSGMGPGAVAADLGRSPDHLNRRVRAELGMSLGAWLNRLRLAEAGNLLRNPGISVGEVAARVGMDDQNYFARWFRRQTGQSPSRWRIAGGR